MRALKIFGALCVCATALACEARDSVGVVCQSISNETASVRGDTVITTTGLRYRDLEVGSGLMARPCRGVTIRTVGRLQNGAVFDSTFTGEAGAFVPGLKVLPVRGVEEGVLGMLEGGKRRLIIPPSLAYGSEARKAEAGSGFADIPANSTLIYDIELLQTVP
ncbi:MAG TPA: FKBP-type peptidyl-prolyl cis-trans isomerase [Longimicrobium sp.]|jgi:FKBP-type peptidyl-prolyl cis-trans isomerase